MSHTVRTTKQPWREIEVDDADYLDLQRQGLLVEDAPAPPPQTASTTEKKTTTTAKSS